MKHTNNFKLVIETIEAERSKNPSSGLELRQTKENKLNTVPINHIINILRDLELGARVLTITKENRPDKKEEPCPQLWDPRKITEAAFNSGISFSIQILDTYEEWFVNYSKDLTSGQKPPSPPEVSSRPALKLSRRFEPRPYGQKTAISGRQKPCPVRTDRPRRTKPPQ